MTVGRLVLHWPPDATHISQIAVTDADTGEQITTVGRLDITLDARCAAPAVAYVTMLADPAGNFKRTGDPELDDTGRIRTITVPWCIARITDRPLE